MPCVLVIHVTIVTVVKLVERLLLGMSWSFSCVTASNIAVQWLVVTEPPWSTAQHRREEKENTESLNNPSRQQRPPHSHNWDSQLSIPRTLHYTN